MQVAIQGGYSEKTAAEQASRLLTNVKVGEAIQAAMKAHPLPRGSEVMVPDTFGFPIVAKVAGATTKK